MRPGLRHLPSVVVLTVFAAFALAPLYFTLIMSQKETGEIIHHMLALPNALHPEYFAQALKFLSGYIGNSIIVSIGVVAGVLAVSMVSGYVFARLDFPGKKPLFSCVIALMFVPGVLTLIPAYLWMKEFPLVGGNDIWGVGGKGLLDSWWVMFGPGISAGQIFGIFFFRSFFENLPQGLFEAARIDGAGELTILWRIVVPVSLPSMASPAILQFLGVYNDYIWPLVTISDARKQLFAVGVTRFMSEGNLDPGPTMAGYVIGAVPLVIIFMFGMRYYVEGLTKGALKA